MLELNEGLSRISNFLRQKALSSENTSEISTTLHQIEILLQTQGQLENILMTIRQKMNEKACPEEILESVFAPLGVLIPLDRIGIAQLDRDEKLLQTVWMRSALPSHQNGIFHSIPIDQTSFREVLDQQKALIFNDLETYVDSNPQAILTRTLVRQGILSSMTFPLFIDSKVNGFIYFASAWKNAYRPEDIELIQKIADEFALIVEHGRLQKYFERTMSKDRTMAMVVHDLKSPLSVIRGFLDLAATEPWFHSLEKKPKELFETLLRNAEAMSSLLTNLSETHSPFTVHPESVPLEKFISDFIHDSEILALRKQITLQSTINCSLPSRARFDPKQIHQVLQNLMSNAIKYSHPFKSIFFEVTALGERLTFSIRDQGQGLPPEEIPKLFNWRGKTSVCPTANEESSGLGLYIAKQIVQSHFGELLVESEVNSGSRFHFWIPAL